ncbi:MetQ/NlpA family ABC transporter substrate-binding protein [Roseburia sp. BX1005]|uniref:Lipoprotein n=1 Tax=Roseburia zhanii TaxID=2763064 RepID=A0A923LMM5_9FIRM|nr:MetQ/NlpA family ABC transporter substrate-binding protein [Roseburia zhanii]MBC5713082.1 MetQ/NlpA family ABC transporter substrate-binding protein [Roseburia zhanii]
MKKKAIGILLTAALIAGVFSGCGSKSDDKTIKVGACVTPHAEILNSVKDKLAEEGWDLEVVEYNDYVLPNTALEDGELDANYFQHKPYLDDFNEENGTHIVGVANVHFEPMAIYAGKTASLDDVADGASVAVPNDTTNEARALLLLEAQGLISLNEDAGVQATVLDITDNPHNLEIKELEAAQVAKSIQDVDFAVINGNYAIEAGLTDPLAVEASDSLAAETYANLIAVKEGNEDSEKTKALVDAVLSDDVRDYINENYEGAVVPVF